MLLRINLLLLFAALSCSGATITQNPAWWGASHPSLLDGLVAYWKLDEASGTRFDSWGTNHLTDVNGVGSDNGKLNLAARPDSTAGKSLRAVYFPSLTNSTYSIWIKGANPAGVVWGRDSADGSAVNRIFVFYQNLLFYFYGSSFTSINAPSYSSSDYTHVVFMINTNHFKIYTNSILFTSNYTATPINIVPSPIEFCGRTLWSASSSTNSLDEPVVWSRNLTTNEISIIYNEGKARRFPFNSGP